MVIGAKCVPKIENIIAEILELELEMFLSVISDQPYSCQKDTEGFKLHREAQFNIWKEDTLSSYLEDLNQAKKEGSNLMTIKYARMENLIPRNNFNPLIEEIVKLKMIWQQEMINKYPNLMTGGRPLSTLDDSINETSFETYLRGELETYSDHTLTLLHRDLIDLFKTGINGTIRIYENLTKMLGYKSIEAADQKKRFFIPDKR